MIEIYIGKPVPVDRHGLRSYPNLSDYPNYMIDLKYI